MTSVTIRIGVIGPEDIVEKIKTVLASFPNFEAEYRVSGDIYDAPIFTKQLMDEENVEVLFYSGYLPYIVSKDEIPAHIPAHYIPLKGSSLYRALYRLNAKKAEPLTGISLDTLQEANCQTAAKELGEAFTFFPYQDLPSLDQKEEILRFHKEQVASGRAGGVLTGMKLVAEALQAEGVVAEWVLPTDEDIAVALERALLSTNTRKNRESQIVFGIVRINEYDKLVAKEHSETGIQRLNLQLHRVLLDYIEQLEGYLTELNREEYLFVTTRGVFERVTEGYKYMPLLEETKKKFDLSLSIGVGFGFSSREAGHHARVALAQAQEYGASTCFIVREDKSVIGPVEMGPPLTYELAVTDQSLLESARKAGTSPSYMTKLLALIHRKNLNQFTAQELASLLGITTRSAHRIMLQWLDAELIEVIGTEKITSRGRPRQIFRLVMQ
ncbi:hypothetical protein [Pontibacillus yanchengensis]|uniref:Transcriptional regulator n=1 Tax=Pontibacillus yanchengensis Y32 TaxID=1385514 RepID=A0A0A2TFI9_9BACI|nr:hypothetical protein [Pontibacillus yanchengensis]KGP74622.1 hypothetical protein N782_00870 [Pontibacillus yanchengensis Y32]